MRNCFISMYEGQWDKPSWLLEKNLNYSIVQLNGKKSPSITSKKVLLKSELDKVIRLIKHWKEFNHSNIIISPNYAALVLLALKKIKILDCRKLIWYGVFIHSPRMLSLINKFLKIIAPRDGTFKIVVFSRAEIKLYAEKLNMDEGAFIYIPLGEWTPVKIIEGHKAEDEGYFFAGGYSNRDYVTLARCFKGKNQKLVIVASKQNKDFVSFCETEGVGSNIKVYWDIEANEFDLLLRNAHAVIFVMKHNTGASGQMVVLSAMRNRKLVITTYTDVMDEYIRDKETGIVLRDVSRELPEIIEEISLLKDPYPYIVENAFKQYTEKFSYQAVSTTLIEQFCKEE